MEQQPRDAEIVLDEDGAHIVPEEPGNLYLPEAFAAAVQAAGFQAKVLRPGEVLSI